MHRIKVKKRYKVGISERIKLKEAYKTFGKSSRRRKARKSRRPGIANKSRQQQFEIKKWKSYKEYLFSKEWQTIRKQKLEQVGNRCQSCDSKNNLQIHHKTYKRIYCEKSKDLIVFCSGCHKKSHNISIENKMMDQHLKTILKEV